MKPLCCDKPATPYLKRIPEQHPHSWESGWRCKRCERIRIPAPGVFQDDPAYMASLEGVRLAGIEFDETL
jgi:hypothetical protein